MCVHGDVFNLQSQNYHITVNIKVINNFPASTPKHFGRTSNIKPCWSSRPKSLQRKKEITAGGDQLLDDFYVSTLCRLEGTNGLKPTWKMMIALHLTHSIQMSNLNTRGTKTKLESIQIRFDSTEWISWRPHEDRQKSQLSGVPLISAAILSSSQERAAETGCLLQGYDRPSHKGRPVCMYCMYSYKTLANAVKDGLRPKRRAQLIFLELYHHTSYLGPLLPSTLGSYQGLIAASSAICPPLAGCTARSEEIEERAGKTQEDRLQHPGRGDQVQPRGK